MIRRLLVANRGEIAVRIARGVREMGIAPLGIFSQADERAYHLRFMDEARCIGPAPAPESYLNARAIVAAAKAMRADAVHPGYGFLSERADFARAVLEAGMLFVGPSPQSMEAMGSKIEAKRRVREFDVPVVPGYDGDDQSLAQLRTQAVAAGFPLLIKASAGGGGRGMRVVQSLDAFDEALEAAKREARGAFGDDAVLLERYLTAPRHIEFQILADEHGTTIHLGERECSIQRRHQKIVEEAPSVALSAQLREEMGQAAIRAAQSVGYVNAGTCEFMLDEDGRYYFLEMNTRLQVEHPVTEFVYGVDLVHWQLRIAQGERLTLPQRIEPRGWSIETRVYAEDPANHLLPSTGTLTRWEPPQGPGIRVDEGVADGSEVSVYYDPMLAKLIVWAQDRAQAIDRLTLALERFTVEGVRSNVPLLLWIARDEAFRGGALSTSFLAERLDESIFRAPPKPTAGELRGAAETVLRECAPWRIAGVGVPLLLNIDGREAVMEAAATGDPNIFRITGDYTGEVDVRTVTHAGPIRFADPPSVDASGHGGGSGGDGRITSPMPGKIASIAVSSGQAVEIHDLLIVLEAMKMEHRIEAPAAGSIGTIHVRQGDIVPADTLLLEFS